MLLLAETGDWRGVLKNQDPFLMSEPLLKLAFPKALTDITYCQDASPWTSCCKLLLTEPRHEDWAQCYGPLCRWHQSLTQSLIYLSALAVRFVYMTGSRVGTPNFPLDPTWTSAWHRADKGMATHSSILAWRIPGTEEPGGLQSMRLQRVRHD